MTSLLDSWNKFYVGRTPQMVDIGAQITEVGKASGTMMMPARSDWLGDPVRGLLHPGALTVLADSACGLAVGASIEKRIPYATLDLRMDYLRPASPDQDIYCDANCFRLSRSVAFTRGSIWQGQRDEPVATVQATFMLSTLEKAGANKGQRIQTASTTPAAAWPLPSRSEPVLPLSPIPYVEYLGIRVAPDEVQPIFRMPYQPKLIGNPTLPALHGGVVAGFAETAANAASDSNAERQQVSEEHRFFD